MDPRNAREGLRDALLDLEEGADALMVTREQIDAFEGLG